MRTNLTIQDYFQELQEGLRDYFRSIGEKMIEDAESNPDTDEEGRESNYYTHRGWLFTYEIERQSDGDWDYMVTLASSGEVVYTISFSDFRPVGGER